MRPSEMEAASPSSDSPSRPWHTPWSRIPLIDAVSTAPWASILAVQLIVITLLLRLVWVAEVPNPNIFDEAFYINAARIIIGLPVPEGLHYANSTPGIDPNTGHMPLAKLMFAGSMLLFGDNPIGWRLPSILLGTLAVGVLYLLIRLLTRNPWLALLAAFLFSFDNLSLVHGRIATLDMPMVALLLVGTYFYMANRPILAGAALALSTLAKLNGIVGIGVIVGFEALRLLLIPEHRDRVKAIAVRMSIAIVAFVTVFIALLWPIDLMFTNYQNPIEHITADLGLGMRLQHGGEPQGNASQPWQWLVNEKKITYYNVNANRLVNGEVVSSRPIVKFSGEMNYYIIGALPLALAYLIYGAFRQRDKLPLLVLAFFAAAYGQPLFLALFFNRISYIYYFLPVLPALCTAIAYFLVDSRLPRVVTVSYVAAVMASFVATFPFREPFG